MNAIVARAVAHSAHLPRLDREQFLLGFNAGLHAGTDTEPFFRSLIAQDATAAAAGFLEGITAARAHHPGCDCTTCLRRIRSIARMKAGAR